MKYPYIGRNEIESIYILFLEKNFGIIIEGMQVGIEKVDERNFIKSDKEKILSNDLFFKNNINLKIKISYYNKIAICYNDKGYVIHTNDSIGIGNCYNIDNSWVDYTGFIVFNNNGLKIHKDKKKFYVIHSFFNNNYFKNIDNLGNHKWVSDYLLATRYNTKEEAKSIIISDLFSERYYINDNLYPPKAFQTACDISMKNNVFKGKTTFRVAEVITDIEDVNDRLYSFNFTVEDEIKLK